MTKSLQVKLSLKITKCFVSVLTPQPMVPALVILYKQKGNGVIDGAPDLPRAVLNSILRTEDLEIYQTNINKIQQERMANIPMDFRMSNPHYISTCIAVELARNQTRLWHKVLSNSQTLLVHYWAHSTQ